MWLRGQQAYIRNRQLIDALMQDAAGSAMLQYAVAFGNNASTVRMLLAHGADPGLPDKFGFTPLQYAKKLGHPDLARLLTEKR